MDSVFGVEIPGAAKFIIAFVVVLALIAVTAWVVRRFGTGALAAAGGRGRQPRLAVIDAASVDARRKLILVRRDNVEHLLMIGGPSDVVIEPNIVRAATARDLGAPRAPAIQDAIPRAAPLEEETLWPLQPEPAPRPQQPPQPVPAPAAAQWNPAPPAPPMEAATTRTPPPDTLHELAGGLATQAPPRTAPKPAAPEVEPPEPATPAATPVPAKTAASEPNLTKMAQQLEAALRRPNGAEPKLDIPLVERASAEPVIGPPTSVSAALEARVAHALEAELAVPEVRPIPSDARPTESKRFYETLEQEMASLLGRGKSS